MGSVTFRLIELWLDRWKRKVTFSVDGHEIIWCESSTDTGEYHQLTHNASSGSCSKLRISRVASPFAFTVINFGSYVMLIIKVRVFIKLSSLL